MPSRDRRQGGAERRPGTLQMMWACPARNIQAGSATRLHALVVLGHHEPRTMARRLRSAQRIAQRTHPYLVVLCGQGEAERMAAQWRGPQLMALDTRSTCTRTNALEAAGWLQAHAITHATLVTSCWHMPRAMAHMQAAAPSVTLTPSRHVDMRGIRHLKRERRIGRENRG